MRKDRRKIFQAVKERKIDVTAADVSSETGLPLETVKDDLTEIVKQDGSIDVKESGELSFQIKDLQESTNLSIAIKSRAAALLAMSAHAIKTSLALLFTTTCLVVFGMIFVICLAISFAFAPFLAYKSNGGEENWLDQIAELPCSNTRPEVAVKQIDHPSPSTAEHSALLKSENNNIQPCKRRGFISECISYLFGHTNPNVDIQEVQMRLIGRLLASRQGIVITEELAPYMLDGTDDQSLLPILMAFDGHPEVSDTGNIIYVFPSFAHVCPLYKEPEPMPGFIEEHPWNGIASTSEKDASANIALAATLNFFGSCWLRAFFVVFQPIAELIMAVNFLLLTSCLCLTLPLIRMSINLVRNKKIADRNAKRKCDLDALLEPSEELRRRLGEAVELRSQLTPPAPARIVYTTSKDLLEQQF